MKTILGLAVFWCVVAACAADKADLDSRIRKLTGKFESLQQLPDKRVPAELLRNAQGVVLLDRTKAGFLFAYQGGAGVALVKDTNTQRWSPVAFVVANEASLGFQIGGEQNFYVILLMTTNATRFLTDPNFQFGGEARGTAGDASAGAEGALPTYNQQPVLVYSDRHGLFGGVAIKGNSVSPDNTANRVYYGQALTMKDILFDGKVAPSDNAVALGDKLTAASRHEPKP